MSSIGYKQLKIHQENCNETSSFDKVNEDMLINNLQNITHLKIQFHQLMSVVKKVVKLFYTALYMSNRIYAYHYICISLIKIVYRN